MSAKDSAGASLAAIASGRGSEQVPTAADAARHARLPVLRVVPLAIEALAQLVVFDRMARRGYQRIYDYTASRSVAKRRADAFTAACVCRAVEEACVWYFKGVFCLQRSSVTTWMLRRRGIRAELVIGYRPAPVDSHAWVEVDGAVVNDRPQYQRFYRVLARY